MQFHKHCISSACRYLALGVIVCNCAFAQTVAWPDFKSITGLTLQGNAATTKTNDGTVLRLTSSQTYQTGSAFTAKAIPFTSAADTFSTYFQFRIANPGGIAPADGIVFVLRDVGTAAIGGGGGAAGYDGIVHSLGVKFDTFQNEREINNNHVAIQSNGVWLDEFTQTPYNAGKCDKPVGIVGCMSNGDLWSVWIDYDGVNIHVALADGSTKRPADLLTAPVSLATILSGATSAYVGFTAATGAGAEDHDIVSWQYFNTYNPTTVGFDQALQANPTDPNRETTRTR